ncbi:MORN Occupation and Recognition repeat-containing protein [Perilla frutescens var. hirtella]|nr:MORN Occupation and Recognition repeat-containing protein [Perilla frutescens var. frutescens]KAH6793606.1 MORN Occupation and Recognition repeat-containing protein [Perilla frutescens var. hirtella]
MTKPGWDPNWVDDDEVEVISDEIKAGRDPPIAPFYVPYRKYYPVIPDNHYDISNPKSVIEELDRIEEFLIWVSYIFQDGSSYEGTVWDDMAHGKGVYIAEQDLVRYEGEWLQNQMEGHGVVEVDIPQMEPIPGSKLEAKMRAEGKIISRDFMSPEDREWLEMDIEDSLRLANGEYEIPFYENDEWIRQFGQKPEKGRYRYAGEWKHGRMHGCGVYEVNERTTWGRFYFGELLEDPSGCDAEVSALHAGIAEVAAAKARMFINKPDGMVREDRGPYSDPQHPYLYEDEDVWMAPGFINQFYEVPDYWKMYVHEVDKERELWLNSFYKAPLRLPMPSELEYWWSNYEEPEFVLMNKEPEPDPENPSQLIYDEDPVIVHTPTGRIIDYVDDEEHGIRLFWQPPKKEGKDANPDEADFLPLGFDEFYGREVIVPPDSWWIGLVKSMESKGTTVLDGLGKWAEDKKKARETKLELLKKEIELVEAESDLKETIEDLDEELKMMQKEEENKSEEVVEEEEETSISEPASQTEQTHPGAEEEDEEEDQEEEDDVTASSFGSAEGQSSTNNDQKGNGFGKSTFAASSLTFGSSNLVSSVLPRNLQNQFLRWKEGRFEKRATALGTYNLHEAASELQSTSSVGFPLATKSLKMRCRGTGHRTHQVQYTSKLSLRNRAKMKALKESEPTVELSILSFHTPLTIT